MKIEVPPDLASALNEHAHQRGESPEKLALAILRERFAPAAAPTEGTLADFLADHVGVLASGEGAGGGEMSEGCGKKFTDALIAKRNQKRL